jgi:hypothetical protein
MCDDVWPGTVKTASAIMRTKKAVKMKASGFSETLANKQPAYTASHPI